MGCGFDVCGGAQKLETARHMLQAQAQQHAAEMAPASEETRAVRDDLAENASQLRALRRAYFTRDANHSAELLTVRCAVQDAQLASVVAGAQQQLDSVTSAFSAQLRFATPAFCFLCFLCALKEY